MTPRTFIVYDIRAADGTTEGATVLAVCDSNAEARNLIGLLGPMSVFSYAHDAADHLTDERFEWNWFPRN